MKKFQDLPEPELARKFAALSKNKNSGTAKKKNGGKRSAQLLLHDLRVHQIELEMQIRALQQAQGEVERARDRFADLYDFAPVGYMSLDGCGHLVDINLTAAALLGRERERLRDKPFGIFVAKEYRLPLSYYLKQLEQSPGTRSLQIRLQRKNKPALEVELTGRATRDGDGNLTGYYVAVLDITARKSAESELQFLGTHDALTQLYNRAYFEAEKTRIENGRQFPVWVLILDVDGLKTVNDTFGHAVGDALLRRVASVLRSVFREGDVVARIGGDEFGVMLPGCDASVGREMLVRLFETLDLHNARNPGPALSFSCGSAVAQSQGLLQFALLHADEEMYKAKLQKADLTARALIRSANADPALVAESPAQPYIAHAMVNTLRRVKQELAYLSQESQTRAQQLALLYDAGLALNRERVPQNQLALLLSIAMKVLHAERAEFFRHDPHGGTLRLELCAGYPPPVADELYKLNWALGEARGLVGWVAAERVPFCLQDITTDPRYISMDVLVRSAMWTPVEYESQLLGVLALSSVRAGAFSPDDQRLLALFANQAAVAIHNADLMDALQTVNENLRSAYDAMIEGWSRALDLRDHETFGHALRVAELSCAVGEQLHLSAGDLQALRWGALLHDIGELGVPDTILGKTSALDDAEMHVMQSHPAIAYNLLEPVSFLRLALDVPLYHHEKWDGTGYPNGLAEQNIPLLARIFAVADVWDALVSERPYRPAWDKDAAFAYILEQSGKQFDPEVVSAFRALRANNALWDKVTRRSGEPVAHELRQG